MGAIIKKIDKGKLISKMTGLDKHSVYGWSGNGEKLSSLTANWFYNHDSKGKSYAEKSIKRWKANRGYPEARCVDCSGFFIWALRDLGAIGAKADYNADTIMGWCSNVSASNVQPGDFAFKIYNTEASAQKAGKHKGDAYHIGLIADVKNGKPVIYSAKGREYECPYVGEAGWNRYGRPNGLYTEEPISMGVAIRSALKKGVKGRKSEVEALQTALLAVGISVGRSGVDGSFGPDTKKAVEVFQARYPETGSLKKGKWVPDGSAGKKTVIKISSLAKGILYWAGN